MSETPTDPRSDIGMGNLDPNRADELAQPNADDEVQVTVHGKYGRGPMPVEFRDALAEMVRLVKQAIDDGALPKRARQQAGAGRGE